MNRTRSDIGRYSREKGTRFERAVARELSKITGMKFRRTPYSGGGHVPGDIMRVDGPFRLEIETKNRKELKLSRIFKNPLLITEYLHPNKIVIFNEDGHRYCVAADICLVIPKLKDLQLHGVIHYDDIRYIIFPMLKFAELIHPYIYEEEN